MGSAEGDGGILLVLAWGPQAARSMDPERRRLRERIAIAAADDERMPGVCPRHGQRACACGGSDG